MFKYKILIKLFVPNCVFICCVYDMIWYGDTIQVAVVVLCLLVSLCCSTVRPADDLCHISFKQNLPEDGHNRCPKHVEGHAVYTTRKINLYIFIIACWFCFSKWNNILFVLGCVFNVQYFAVFSKFHSQYKHLFSDLLNSFFPDVNNTAMNMQT